MNIKNAEGKYITTKIGCLKIIKKLGKGKSGYSYLASNANKKYVIKFMHNELCSYYSFGSESKVKLELNAYNLLNKLKISIPKLYNINIKDNYLVKEYIDGELITDSIVNNRLNDASLRQVFIISKKLKASKINIDYFPDNFIYADKKLYYIDYECNPYDEEWNLENWGLYYWANSQGLSAYKKTHDDTFINDKTNNGRPIKKGFDNIVNHWISQYQ
ncbi:hypothetical protein [Vibrio salinus]|uniref:hypothetical protein n=1 Tax=Vibrio salinus TaxID=2899784 RepID=UPI001E2F1CBC|nr:hypothetical protein [Vibrio salinus]MCE0495959.1 hypothetical protein [Vibrio salinus]